MKKLMIVMAMLGLVAIAQADNVWNIKWSIVGAYSPDDDTKGVLEDYSVTWSLILDSTGETIASMYAAKGSEEISIADPFGDNTDRVLSYNAKLKPDDVTTFYGSTTLSGTYDVYQYIFIDNGVDQYEWKSATAAIEIATPPVTKTGQPIDMYASLGKNTPWTKVTTVPEPATMSLLGLGALAMILRRRIRR